ncbi:N-acetyltransferase [Halolactibacillus alkaliphilus]|uniref:N-acetyltransferase n=1 Tax=Halolactibacillus alkaliphilus TaxID=442899 RepID=A0A511X1H2_9BACI|nr:GNAT family N-acetyltransferase [Halolactibacillus alkaliphilus]GEN56785.1 N-acetyltransferase [Halolactibacillus alkaliphilus]GGN71195.1 N-acetyltransferase [Halolactibacillus alkaliphilus]SFO81318.1 Predicted N-acyltransferase, GNAT family [Halolactibacillus alkaliphilus]
MDIIKATTHKEREDAFSVREAVFINEQGVDASIERDALDDTATHIIGYINQSPVACLRFTSYSQAAKVQRMAVIKAHREEGLGKKLMLEAEVHMKQAGFTKSILHAQTHAAGFYQQLGYTKVSKPFLEANIAHVAMEKNL